MQNEPLIIRPLSHNSEELRRLADVALAEGVRNVSRLAEALPFQQPIAGYHDGLGDKAGEMILAAWQGSHLLGVGGRTWCPDVEGALRMRRFYVAPLARRRGIAHRLVAALLADADAYCEFVTCNAAASDAAPLFWEAVGFVPFDHAGITHLLNLSQRP